MISVSARSITADEYLISQYSTETLMHMPHEFRVTHCSAKPGMQNYFQVRLMLSRRSKEIHGKIGIYAAPLNFQNYASLRSYTEYHGSYHRRICRKVKALCNLMWQIFCNRRRITVNSCRITRSSSSLFESRELFFFIFN